MLSWMWGKSTLFTYDESVSWSSNLEASVDIPQKVNYISNISQVPHFWRYALRNLYTTKEFIYFFINVYYISIHNIPITIGYILDFHKLMDR